MNTEAAASHARAAGAARTRRVPVTRIAQIATLLLARRLVQLRPPVSTLVGSENRLLGERKFRKRFFRMRSTKKATKFGTAGGPPQLQAELVPASGND
jgi:hypothetical protein